MFGSRNNAEGKSVPFNVAASKSNLEGHTFFGRDALGVGSWRIVSRRHVNRDDCLVGIGLAIAQLVRKTIRTVVVLVRRIGEIRSSAIQDTMLRRLNDRVDQGIVLRIS